MVQRSDDKGDKRSPGKTETGAAQTGASASQTAPDASQDAESNAANALRERIRQAGGAATARASDHAPPASGLLVPSSAAPPSAEISGVRTLPHERPKSTTPPLFGAPKLTPGAMAVPWPTPAPPRKREPLPTSVGLGPPPEKREPPRTPVDPRSTTQGPGSSPPSGLGWGAQKTPEPDDPSLRTTERISLPLPLPVTDAPAPRGSIPTPRGMAPPAAPPDTWALSNARTQPMPRVRNNPSRREPAPSVDALREAEARTRARVDEAEERRRAELATTRKTQGLLRAPDSSSSNVGRYSVHDVSTEYVDTGAPEPITAEQPALPEDIAAATLPSPDEAIIYESEPPPPPTDVEVNDTRPRRSTPKQRVGHRRSTRPEIGHARERGTKRTDPGIRARTLRGSAGPTKNATTPLPAVKSSPAPVTAPLAAPVRGPASPARPPPLPPATPIETSTVVVDPSLTTPVPPPTLPTQKHEYPSYVPLPRDREAYEAFLRSAASEHGGPPRTRPSWAQQETALIPREALEPPFEAEVARSIWRAPVFKSAVGLGLIAVSVGTLWWSLQDTPGSPEATEVSSAALKAAPGVQRQITLIATEPSGAELVHDNAVIGNTPLEVVRPTEGEVLYTLRLKGFEPQLVRVTGATHSAIHITLQPAPDGR